MSNQMNTRKEVTIAPSRIVVFDCLIQSLEAAIEETTPYLWNSNIEYHEITSLLTTVISHQSYFVEHLIVKKDESPLAHLKSILSSSLTRLQKIDVLELLGSAYIMYDPYTAFVYGIPCLREALVLRQPSEDGQSAIAKVHQPHPDHFYNAIGNTCEITTLEQLEQLAGDHHRLYIQAFNMSQRILNRLVPRPYPYLLNSLLGYATRCWKRNQFKRVVTISLLILEPFKPCQWIRLTDEICSLIVAALHVMSPSLRNLYESTEGGKELLTFANVMLTLNFAIAHVAHTITEFAKERTNQPLNSQNFDDGKTYFIFDLISLVCDMLPTFNQKQILQFKETLAQFIQLLEKSGLSQRPLLHIACNKQNVPNDLIELLLAAGADPNSLDNEGNTPLYLLANKNWEYVLKNIKAAEILIKYGARLDKKNNVTSKTVQQRFQERQKIYWKENQIQSGSFHPLFNSVFSLESYSAKVIQHHQILYDSLLPSSLHDIVRRC